MPTTPQLTARHDAATGISYTIRKTVGEREYVVRFHQDGIFMPAWTCYETDREAARHSGDATIRHAAESAARLKQLAADAAANVTRVQCGNQLAGIPADRYAMECAAAAASLAASRTTAERQERDRVRFANNITADAAIAQNRPTYRCTRCSSPTPAGQSCDCFDNGCE